MTGSAPTSFDRKPANTRRWIIAFSVIVLVGAVSATALVFWQSRGQDTDERRIRTVVSAFASAISAGNPTAIADLLCEEEATALAASGALENNPGDGNTSDRTPAAKVTEIHINGTVASTRVTALSGSQRTLYLRKEGNTWKICAPAGDSPPK